MVQHKCLVCTNKVSENDKCGSISCSQCQRWCHATCTTPRLHPETVKNLNEIWTTTGHHYWSCEGCSLAFANLTRRMSQFEKDVAGVKVNVLTNTQNIQANSDKLESVVKDVEKSKQDRVQDKADAVADATKVWSRELRERENKKCNVIIYGLAEPSPEVESGIARKEADLEQLKSLLDDMGAIVDIKEDIKFSFRPGVLNMDTVEEDPRPLNVGFRTQENQEQLFSKARNLRNSTKFRKVSIVPDLTSLQRKEDHDLIKEAEKLNEDMSERDQGNWVYRCVGRKGQRVISKLKVRDNPMAPRGGLRGNSRGARGGRGRQSYSNPNLLPLGPRNNFQNRDNQPINQLPETPVALDESLMHGWDNPDPTRGAKRLPSSSPDSHSPDQRDQSPDLSQARHRTSRTNANTKKQKNNQ